MSEYNELKLRVTKKSAKANLNYKKKSFVMKTLSNVIWNSVNTSVSKKISYKKRVFYVKMDNE